MLRPHKSFATGILSLAIVASVNVFADAASDSAAAVAKAEESIKRNTETAAKALKKIKELETQKEEKCSGEAIKQDPGACDSVKEELANQKEKFRKATDQIATDKASIQANSGRQAKAQDNAPPQEGPGLAANEGQPKGDGDGKGGGMMPPPAAPPGGDKGEGDDKGGEDKAKAPQEDNSQLANFKEMEKKQDATQNPTPATEQKSALDQYKELLAAREETESPPDTATQAKSDFELAQAEADARTAEQIRIIETNMNALQKEALETSDADDLGSTGAEPETKAQTPRQRLLSGATDGGQGREGSSVQNKLGMNSRP